MVIFIEWNLKYKVRAIRFGLKSVVQTVIVVIYRDNNVQIVEDDID